MCWSLYYRHPVLIAGVELAGANKRRANFAVKPDQCKASSQNIHCTSLVSWSGQLHADAEAHTNVLYVHIYVCACMYLHTYYIHCTHLHELIASFPMMMLARSVLEGALPGHKAARPSAAMMRGSLLMQVTMGCNKSSFRHCITCRTSCSLW